MRIPPRKKGDDTPPELYYMPLLVGDFLGSPSTQAMNAEEVGAYMLALMHCWASGKCRISRADICAGTLIRCGRNRARVAEKILKCFRDTDEPGYVTNDKLQHVWNEALSTYKKNSTKARGAALARWGKTGNGCVEECSEHAPSIDGAMLQAMRDASQSPNNKSLPSEEESLSDSLSGGEAAASPSKNDCEAVVSSYNELGLIESELTPERLDVIRRRLRKDREFLTNWRIALGKVRESAFLMGKVNGFKATIDWLLKPANFTKVKEGNYANGKGHGASKGIKRFDGDTYHPDAGGDFGDQTY